jgi:hypothetical protein
MSFSKSTPLQQQVIGDYVRIKFVIYFSITHSNISIQQLLQDMLGKGAYGVVFRGHHSDVRKGRNMVAIKIIQIDVAAKKGSNIKV